MTYSVVERAKQTLTGDLKRWARCWKMTRKDGFVHRVTNHSNQLEIATSFNPYTLETFTPVEVTTNRESMRRVVGIDPDTDAIFGFISDSGWTPENARVGLYQDVRVDIFDVDWRHPWSGYFVRAVYFVVDAKWSGEVIEFRLASLAQRAQVAIGRTYSRRCDAILGDSRCTKDISGLNSGTKTVSAVAPGGTNPRLRFESDLTSQPDGFWTDGILTWLTGNNAISGIENHDVKVSKQTDGVLELWTPTPYDIEIGDTFSVKPGCKKLFNQDCVGKFSNGDNHRGFRHMTGFDKVIEGPDSPF